MSFKLFPDRIPSVWRLGILLVILMIFSNALSIIAANLALRKDLGGIARAVVLDDLKEYSVFYRHGGLTEIRKVFAAGKHELDQAIRITSPDGALLFEKISPSVSGFNWPTISSAEINPARASLTKISHPQNDQKLLIGSEKLHDGNVIWFGRTDREDRFYMEHIRNRIWLAGLISMGFMCLPLWWFVSHVLKPIKNMMLSVSSLAAGKPSDPLTLPNAAPELKAFVNAFKEGLDRIAALTSELQSANDTLAHELRTPLARIRGNLESLYDHTPNQAAKLAAAKGIEEIDRAAHLIRSILTIRAGEHQALILHLEKTDLQELLQNLTDLYLPSAELRDIELSLTSKDSLVVTIDRQRLAQAISNLLDNALAYTPSGGKIEIRLQEEDTQVRVVVTDTGYGLDENEVIRIWERHVRGSAANALTEGIGLGLCLVKSIAKAHQGTWGCKNCSDQSGSEFWISLPLSNDFVRQYIK